MKLRDELLKLKKFVVLNYKYHKLTVNYTLYYKFHTKNYTL